MNVRYLLVLSDAEGIHCIGNLPRIGEQVTVRKRYGEREILLCRVVNVRYNVDVHDLPDEYGTRGQETKDDLPEVFVSIERRS